jgi:hypothetical protein
VRRTRKPPRVDRAKHKRDQHLALWAKLARFRPEKISRFVEKAFRHGLPFILLSVNTKRREVRVELTNGKRLIYSLR